MNTKKDKEVKQKVEECVQYARSAQQFRKMLNDRGLDVHRLSSNYYIVKDSKRMQLYKHQIPKVFSDDLEKLHKRKQQLEQVKSKKINRSKEMQIKL